MRCRNSRDNHHLFNLDVEAPNEPNCQTGRLRSGLEQRLGPHETLVDHWTRSPGAIAASVASGRVVTSGMSVVYGTRGFGSGGIGPIPWGFWTSHYGKQARRRLPPSRREISVGAVSHESIRVDSGMLAVSEGQGLGSFSGRTGRPRTLDRTEVCGAAIGCS